MGGAGGLGLKAESKKNNPKIPAPIEIKGLAFSDITF
jgi:hypothetical protein